MRLPKGPFRAFDKWENESEQFMIRFYFYLNMENEI